MIGLALVRPTVAADKPNFIILFADDLGYGDLGCYGSKTIRTPRIDRMAAEGIRFTDFYAAAPYCSPSRASLLTGRYPARCGVPHVLFPVEKAGLPAAELTIAELLKENGYATACIGKWHLGMEKPFHPNSQGFDLYYGIPHSNDSHWPKGEPFKPHYAPYELPLIENDHVIEAPVDQNTVTKRYTERALRFIQENQERPFFLYLPHTFPHKPQYASSAFEGKSAAGLYGDSVEEIDWSVGKILDELRALKLAERTLVMFTSDNGPAASRIGKQGNAFGLRDGGGSADPLRGGKGQTYEGGMRVPGIFCWAGTIKPKQATSTVASILDLLPTCAALAGAALPRDRVFDGADLSPFLKGDAGRGPIQPLQDRPFYYYFGVQLQAVRQGKWKLFLPIDRRPKERPPTLWYKVSPETYERHYRLQAEAVLYDLSADIAEQRNLSAAHPAIVARLIETARTFDTQLLATKRAPVYLEELEIPAR